jgi:diadenosine tetraphosphate (Ap4A) HIT family hydrolase
MTCKANRGELRAPGGVIHNDALWQVEHILEPLPMLGWLIVKALRHVTAFADLTDDEAATFGPLVRRSMAALQRATAAEKVYGEPDRFILALHTERNPVGGAGRGVLRRG